jgi:Primase C terminal 1 (PriCT-1)
MYFDESTTGLIKENDHEVTLVRNLNQEAEARKFLDILYPNYKGEGHLVLWTKQDKQSRFFSIGEFGEAPRQAAFLCQEMDVYFGVGLQAKMPEHGGRGRADTVVAIPGLWMDIDVKGDNHKSEQLPQTFGAALKFIESIKLKPTMIVSTGGGLHAYWLFNDPMAIGDPQQWQKAKKLSQDFQKILISLAADRGWKIDLTADLSRLLRLPGTYNHKQGHRVPVSITKYHETSRYKLEEIERFTTGFQVPTETRDLSVGPERILEGSRNDTLTSIGGALRANKADYDEVYRKLMEINRTRCVPPLSEEEVESIARSVTQYQAGNDKGGQPKQSQQIIELTDGIGLFHTSKGENYAAVPVNGHREIWSLTSRQFRQYLSKIYYERHGKPPGSQALQDALEVLRGKASFDSPEQEVSIRLAKFDDSIYIDLCDDDWQAVRITSNGWEVVKETPVSFVRSNGMSSLPVPVAGGNLELLRETLNVKESDEWLLILSWLVGAFNPTGPYEILILHGEQGSAKSTTAKILKQLIDPSSVPLRTLPTKEHDLMISAKNSWVIAYDNLSGIKTWLSDAFCRLSTGGGFSTRGLYTDSDEIIFQAMRPLILNGIDDIADRQDLADRSLMVNLPRIPENRRKLERQLWWDFEKNRPTILGAILDVVSFAIKNYRNVKLEAPPRMADFGHWVVAAEPELPWRSGKFLEVYKRNRDEASVSCFESDVVAMAVKAFIDEHKNWEGTASDLKKQLEKHSNNDEQTKDPSWPKRPNYLSTRIRRIAPPLRSIGISVDEVRVNGKKLWKFKMN